MFIYRIADIEDVPNIARLFRWHYWPMSLECVRNKIYSIFSEAQGQRYCFIACRKNTVVGIIIAKEECSMDTQHPFWYLDMLYIDFFYRHLGIAPQLGLFALREGVKKNITEFRGISIKGMQPYVENKFKSLNLDKVGLLIINEESASISNEFVHKRLSYTLKITHRNILLKYQLSKLR